MCLLLSSSDTLFSYYPLPAQNNGTVCAKDPRKGLTQKNGIQ